MKYCYVLECQNEYFLMICFIIISDDGYSRGNLHDFEKHWRFCDVSSLSLRAQTRFEWFGLSVWPIMNYVWIVLQSWVSDDAFFALLGKFLTTIARSWRIYPCWPLNNLKSNDSNRNYQSLLWSIKSVKMQYMDVKSKHQSPNMIVTSTLWT